MGAGDGPGRERDRDRALRCLAWRGPWPRRVKLLAAALGSTPPGGGRGAARQTFGAKRLRRQNQPERPR